jgi:hypothetical protein
VHRVSCASPPTSVSLTNAHRVLNRINDAHIHGMNAHYERIRLQLDTVPDSWRQVIAEGVMVGHLRYNVHVVPADGNCFYHSVSLALPNREEFTAAHLRATAADLFALLRQDAWMKSLFEFTVGSDTDIERHDDSMRRNGHHADLVDLVCVAAHLQIDFLIFCRRDNAINMQSLHTRMAQLLPPAMQRQMHTRWLIRNQQLHTGHIDLWLCNACAPMDNSKNVNHYVLLEASSSASPITRRFELDDIFGENVQTPVPIEIGSQNAEDDITSEVLDVELASCRDSGHTATLLNIVADADTKILSAIPIADDANPVVDATLSDAAQHFADDLNTSWADIPIEAHSDSDVSDGQTTPPTQWSRPPSQPSTPNISHWQRTTLRCKATRRTRSSPAALRPRSFRGTYPQ